GLFGGRGGQGAQRGGQGAQWTGRGGAGQAGRAQAAGRAQHGGGLKPVQGGRRRTPTRRRERALHQQRQTCQLGGGQQGRRQTPGAELLGAPGRVGVR